MGEIDERMKKLEEGDGGLEGGREREAWSEGGRERKGGRREKGKEFWKLFST